MTEFIRLLVTVFLVAVHELFKLVLTLKPLILQRL